MNHTMISKSGQPKTSRLRGYTEEAVQGRTVHIPEYSESPSPEARWQSLGVELRDLTERKQAEDALKQRVKELNCIYEISRLIDAHDDSLETILHRIPNLLARASRFPEICRARLVLQEHTFESSDFCESSRLASEPILVRRQMVGRIDLYYLRNPESALPDPFIPEERSLLRVVAERVGKMIDRTWTTSELQAEKLSLKEANLALHAIMDRIEEEKRSVMRSVAENVEKILVPLVNSMEDQMPLQQRRYMALLRERLEGIASPFVNSLSSAFGSLTPTEVKVCDLIRTGYTTKEIAKLRGVALATVNKQREVIRRKLHLSHSDKNLATHLDCLFSRQS